MTLGWKQNFEVDLAFDLLDTGGPAPTDNLIEQAGMKPEV